MERPLHTYEQNVTGTQVLLERMLAHGRARAGVLLQRGHLRHPGRRPGHRADRRPGRSRRTGRRKLIGEWLLRDVARAHRPAAHLAALLQRRRLRVRRPATTPARTTCSRWCSRRCPRAGRPQVFGTDYPTPGRLLRARLRARAGPRAGPRRGGRGAGGRAGRWSRSTTSAAATACPCCRSWTPSAGSPASTSSPSCARAARATRRGSSPPGSSPPATSAGRCGTPSRTRWRARGGPCTASRVSAGAVGDQAAGDGPARGRSSRRRASAAGSRTLRPSRMCRVRTIPPSVAGSRLAVLLPLGEQQHRVGPGRRPPATVSAKCRSGQARRAFSRAAGSVTTTSAPCSRICAATLSAGESRMSSLSGLNAAPEHARPAGPGTSRRAPRGPGRPSGPGGAC